MFASNNPGSLRHCLAMTAFLHGLVMTKAEPQSVIASMSEAIHVRHTYM